MIVLHVLSTCAGPELLSRGQRLDPAFPGGQEQGKALLPNKETHKNHNDFCSRDPHVQGCLHWPQPSGLAQQLHSRDTSSASVRGRGVQWGKWMHPRGAATDEDIFLGEDFFYYVKIPGQENWLRYRHGYSVIHYSVTTNSKEGTQKDLTGDRKCLQLKRGKKLSFLRCPSSLPQVQRPGKAIVFPASP